MNMKVNVIIVFTGKSACSFYPTCVECRDDPACGWCDDGSGTGLGQCLPGGNAGPNQPSLSCAAGRWFFTECPSESCCLATLTQSFPRGLYLRTGFHLWFLFHVVGWKANMIDAENSVMYGCCKVWLVFYLCSPACQCNGHSVCPANSSVCNQPCANLTQGPHCEHCVLGYYGNPINGGKCIRKYKVSLKFLWCNFFLYCAQSATLNHIWSCS